MHWYAVLLGSREVCRNGTVASVGFRHASGGRGDRNFVHTTTFSEMDGGDNATDLIIGANISTSTSSCVKTGLDIRMFAFQAC